MTHKNRINMYEGLASYFLPPGVLEYFDNKDGHGGKGSVVAVVKGTKPCDVLKVLMQLPGSERNKGQKRYDGPLGQHACNNQRSVSQGNGNTRLLSCG